MADHRDRDGARGILFGVAGLVFADYAGAPDVAWSWLAIAAGIGFWILVRIEDAREATPA